MFRRFINKRLAVGLGAAALAVFGAVAAFAFFTGSGSGSGPATVASDSGVNINSVSFGTNQLYPAHTTPVTFTVSNPSPSVSLSVSSVIADTSTYTNGISGLTTNANATPSTCDPASFSFAPVTVTTELPPHGSTVETGGVYMTDASTNQDACKGQTPTLNLTVKNP